MCEWLEAKLAQWTLAASRATLALLSGTLFRPVSNKAVGHIVVYRVGNIGDTVVAIPALTGIRQAYPEATITLLTSAGNNDLPGAAMVLESFSGLINRIISYVPADIKRINGLNALKRTVCEAGPVDVFVDLPVSMQTLRRGLQEVFLARWLGSRSAYGFQQILPDLFRVSYCRRFPDRIPQTVEWLRGIVQKEPGSADARNNPALQAQLEPTSLHNRNKSTPEVPPNLSSENTAIQNPVQVDPLQAFQPVAALDWNALGLNPSHPLLAVNAGAKLAIKRWPKESFQACLRQLQVRIPELQIALLGNHAEQALNNEIMNGLPDASGSVVNLSGRLNLSETWALLSKASAVLSNDTGTMHMAGLLNKPVFTPMSGQYPARLWHPPGEHFTAFRQAVPCAPCLKEVCPLPEQICLTEIQPEELAEAMTCTLKNAGGLCNAGL